MKIPTGLGQFEQILNSVVMEFNIGLGVISFLVFLPFF
jgi:hypothetical protein